MFARTRRLLLRPGFPEDAPALARGDRRRGDRAQSRNRAVAVPGARRRGLSRQRARPGPAVLPDLRAHRRGARSWSARAGSAGVRRARSSWAIGSPVRHWSRGFATEASLALIDIARGLGLPQLEGLALPRQSRLGARAREARLRADGDRRSEDQLRARHRSPARLMRLELAAEASGRRGAGRLGRAPHLPRRLGRVDRARVVRARADARSSSFHGWKPGRKNLNHAPAILRNIPGRPTNTTAGSPRREAR